MYDPTVSKAPKSLLHGNITICQSPVEAALEADVVAVLTEWDEFRWIDPVDVARVVKARQIVDARNLLDRSNWVRNDFEYQGIGR
jgi:UDPglucose 6-dehydrogenase